jgi:4-alpha-glucanotransferase
MNERGSGILLHISSLPTPFGIGDLGPSAFQFADFLADTKQRFWQILPLTPTDTPHGNSPYHSDSAFAANPLIISPEILLGDGWLDHADVINHPEFSSNRVEYDPAISFKETIIEKIWDRVQLLHEIEGYETFYSRNAYWLDDYARFQALKTHFQGKAWYEWPADFRDRTPEALEWTRHEFDDAIQRVCLCQYLLYKQWISLKTYCNQKGIRIIGDIPIYVVHDSADVWGYPNYFNLDSDKRPQTVAGVPPDYFSDTGQLWGNPVYCWEALKERGYDWWIRRIKHNLELYDYMRIDHFRGFVSYWEIPATETNAINGRWVDAPGWDFFKRITSDFPDLPIIAEDLGFITPDVHELMGHFKFPGMKVLLFAFGDDLPTNPYAPHNLERNFVVYTGTHDNNTVRGWFETEATSEVKKRLFRYLGKEVSAEEISRTLIRLAMMSVANTTIVPLQDLLGLGERGRMNTPGTPQGNWEWRFDPSLLTPDVADELRKMTEIYGRG